MDQIQKNPNLNSSEPYSSTKQELQTSNSKNLELETHKQGSTKHYAGLWKLESKTN